MRKTQKLSIRPAPAEFLYLSSSLTNSLGYELDAVFLVRRGEPSLAIQSNYQRLMRDSIYMACMGELLRPGSELALANLPSVGL